MGDGLDLRSLWCSRAGGHVHRSNYVAAMTIPTTESQLAALRKAAAEWLDEWEWDVETVLGERGGDLHAEGKAEADKKFAARRAMLEPPT